MTTRFAKVKKFAGLAGLTMAVTAVGLGFGPGTAQATTMQPCPQTLIICRQIQLHNQFADGFFDRFQGLFRVGEGTRFDNAVDRFFGAK